MAEYLNIETEASQVLEAKEYYNLEERTFQFALRVRSFIKKIPKTISNTEDSIQLTRSSGSVGANYIEANDSISKKDFLFRIKICRKEAKESKYFLKLIDLGNDPSLETERMFLVNESHELMLIFASILRKVEAKV